MSEDWVDCPLRRSLAHNLVQKSASPPDMPPVAVAQAPREKAHFAPPLVESAVAFNAPNAAPPSPVSFNVRVGFPLSCDRYMAACR